jgi:hypothetical protein
MPLHARDAELCCGRVIWRRFATWSLHEKHACEAGFSSRLGGSALDAGPATWPVVRSSQLTPMCDSIPRRPPPTSEEREPDSAPARPLPGRLALPRRGLPRRRPRQEVRPLRDSETRAPTSTGIHRTGALGPREIRRRCDMPAHASGADFLGAVRSGPDGVSGPTDAGEAGPAPRGGSRNVEMSCVSRAG